MSLVFGLVVRKINIRMVSEFFLACQTKGPQHAWLFDLHSFSLNDESSYTPTYRFQTCIPSYYKHRTAQRILPGHFLS